METLDRDSRYHTVANPTDPEPVELPEIGLDTAILAGYIQNFDPKSGYTLDILKTNDFRRDKEYLLSVEENGYFEIKVPLMHTSQPMRNGLITPPFLTPGKRTFLFQGSDKDSKYLIMGENARLSMDIYKHGKTSSPSHQDKAKMYEMGVEKWRSLCEKSGMEDSIRLESLKASGTISKQFYELQKLENTLTHFRDIMDINAGITSDPTILLDPSDIPRKPEYFDFLTDEIVNNPACLLSPTFNNYINRLEYLKVGEEDYRLESLESLYEKGFPFTDKEKSLVEEYLKIYSKKWRKTTDEFNSKYEEATRNFLEKYYKLYPSQYAELDITQFSEFLKQENVSLTEEEEEYVRARDKFSTNKVIETTNRFHQENKEQIQELTNGPILIWKMNNYRNAKLEKYYGIKKGIASDVMLARDLLGLLDQRKQSIPEKQLEWILKDIENEGIAEYLRWTNKKAKLAHIQPSHLREIPDVPIDSIFSSILSQYRGKVIYLELIPHFFSRSIQRLEKLETLKPELGDEIVYVDISSYRHKDLYEQLASKFSGEHYFIDDQRDWFKIKQRLQPSSFSYVSYLLIDQQGRIVKVEVTTDIPKLKQQLLGLLE